MANLSKEQKEMFVNYLLNEGMNPEMVRRVLRDPSVARTLVELLKPAAPDAPLWTSFDTAQDAPRDSRLGESGDNLTAVRSLTNVPVLLEVINRTLPVRVVCAELGLVIMDQHVVPLLEKHRASHPSIEDGVCVTPLEGGKGQSGKQAFDSVLVLKQSPIDGWALLEVARAIERIPYERFLVALWGAEQFGRVLVLGNMQMRRVLLTQQVEKPLPGNTRIPVRTPIAA